MRCLTRAIGQPILDIDISINRVTTIRLLNSQPSDLPLPPPAMLDNSENHFVMIPGFYHNAELQPTGPKSLSQTQWQTRINNLELNLSYEPMFWMVGNSRAEQIINTEIRSADEAKNNWVGRRREYEYARRSPDFTIEVRRGNELLGLLVMDAKYTTMDLSFKHYLPECTMKYVHGIARADAKTNDKRIVKAMVIVYADRFDQFMDFHAAPYDAYGEKTQLPILGVQALSLKSPDQAGMRSLEMLLDRMLELISLAT